MKILVTGAKGFVGRNLCAQLKNIRDGKAKNYGISPRTSFGRNDKEGVSVVISSEVEKSLSIDEVFEYDLDSTPEELERWCAEADFVFNLAGVNRPKNQEEFMAGNFGFASTLLETLRRHGNKCPVMLASSQQASLTGRFGDSEYGRSKKAGEDLFLRYGEEIGSTGSPTADVASAASVGSVGELVEPVEPAEATAGLRPRVLVYRFPNLFGKWCRPNYNSAVATFCNAIANDLPYTVNDPSVELELLYIDDLVDEMIAALKGREHRCEFDGLTVIPEEEISPRGSSSLGRDDKEGASSLGRDNRKGRYCYAPVTHKATLGEIVDLLNKFAAQPKSLLIPDIPAGSFAKKLYSTYLSYLPKEKVAFPLKMNEDARGSFTELVKTIGNGQVSVNISKPGITKGQHWHNTKWEFFIVVAGHALIQERRIGTDEVLEFEVSGEQIQAVHMLPGYTHNIINLSTTDDLVTVMWANEPFDPERPDTYFEPVE